jgi:hypothetical protein
MATSGSQHNDEDPSDQNHDVSVSLYSRRDSDLNDTGSGSHNPKYDKDYLDVHLESQAMKPMSPYDDPNPNTDWYTSTEPDLPPYDPDSKLVYRPLSYDPSKRWIRVLKLEPGWVYLKLRCSLIHINIDDEDHVPYEAISYTWGKYYENIQHDGRNRDQRFDQILCDGTWTDVTRSLSHALQKLRLTDRPRILWADALCINQSDEKEKSWQVRLMTNIYSSAFHVLIWVGYRDPKVVKGTMDLICQIVNQERTEEERRGVEARWYNEESIMETPGTPELSADSPSSIYEEDLPAKPQEKLALNVETLRPLVHLFEGRYFSRLWVFQEVALSPGATMCWSNARIRFEWVAIVANLVNRIYRHEFVSFGALVYTGLSNCAHMYNAWTGMFATRSFFKLLLCTSTLIAFEPRDKIFGLLGIKTRDSDPTNNNLFISVDYTRPKYEVYREVARKVLLLDKDLQCLAVAEHFLGELPIAEASWVPDFSTHLPVSFLDLEANPHANTAPVVRDGTETAACSQRDCLIVGGIQVDTVTTIIHPGLETELLWQTASRLRCLQLLIQQLRQTSSDTDIAVCLTGGVALDRYDSKVTDLSTHERAMQLFATWNGDVSDLEEGEHEIDIPSPDASFANKSSYSFFQASALATMDRSIILTWSGRLGLVRPSVKVGDAVVVFFGCNVPIVLSEAKVGRKGETLEGHWRVVSQAYVCGLMEGQGVESWRESDEEAEEFHII